MKTQTLLLLLLFLFLTSCALAIGPQAQANAGSIVTNTHEGATAVVGVGNQVQTPAEPLPAATAANSQRFAPIWVFLLSVTGLIIGILLGLYMVTREPESVKGDGCY